MDFSGFIAPGLDFIGNLIGRDDARSMAHQQMDFQERMDNTRYQRATADMLAAGLNPALMYSSGGPGGAPVGANSQPVNLFGGVSNSALSAIRLRQELKNLVSQEYATRAQGVREDSQAALNHVQAGLVQDQRRKMVFDARTAAAEARIAEAQVPGALQEAAIDSTKIGTAARLVNRFNPLGHSAASLIRSVR
jgi:hypothetical protein